MNNHIIHKPPDPPPIYRILKCPLKSILKKYKVLFPIIDKAVIDTNEIVILSYHRLRVDCTCYINLTTS